MIKYVLFVAVVVAVALVYVFRVYSREKQRLADAGVDLRTGIAGKTVVDVLPLRGYDAEHHCYTLKDDKLMDIMQIQAHDLVNASDGDIRYDNAKFEKLYRLTNDDLKLIAMNFPCDVKEQTRYMKRMVEKTDNPVYKRVLRRKLDELDYLGKHNTTREYYIMYFASSFEELERIKRTIKVTLHTGRDGLVNEIEDRKKHQIIYRLTNKNALLA